jgi:transcriptional regulator with XRE-family HTH domain
MESNLKKLRGSLGLNQSEFWIPLGVTQSGGSRYESGNRPIPKPIQKLLRLAYGTTREAQDQFDFLRGKKRDAFAREN